MTVRDSITRTGARTPGAEDYPTSMAAHGRASHPTQCGITEVASMCARGRHKPNISRCMPGAGLSRPCAGRCCPTCQPSTRIGDSPPYGMIGRVEETSASFEARSAPRLYPTIPAPADIRLLHTQDRPARREYETACLLTPLARSHCHAPAAEDAPAHTARLRVNTHNSTPVYTRLRLAAGRPPCQLRKAGQPMRSAYRALLGDRRWSG